MKNLLYFLPSTSTSIGDKSIFSRVNLFFHDGNWWMISWSLPQPTSFCILLSHLVLLRRTASEQAGGNWLQYKVTSSHISSKLSWWSNILQPLQVCSSSAEPNTGWEILQCYVMLVSWIQIKYHDEEDSWVTSLPPVVVGQLLQRLCSACKGIPLQSHSHLLVEFPVHSCKPFCLPVFASQSCITLVQSCGKQDPVSQSKRHS